MDHCPELKTVASNLVDMDISEVVRNTQNEITAVCNLEGQWCISIEKAIVMIEAGSRPMYVTDDADRIPVKVAYRNGEKYLTTLGDENKLNDLPRCSMEQAIPYLTDPRAPIP